MIDNRIQVVYVAGIALNALALVLTASRGDWVLAGTVCVVIVYLLFRFRMAADP